jgi:hypothetical protein
LLEGDGTPAEVIFRLKHGTLLFLLGSNRCAASSRRRHPRHHVVAVEANRGRLGRGAIGQSLCARADEAAFQKDDLASPVALVASNGTNLGPIAGPLSVEVVLIESTAL